MNRRRKKFVRADLQIRIVFIALFVASLVLLINFQMSLATLWTVSGQPAVSVESAIDEIRHQLVRKFLVSVGLTIPLAVSVGILYSFKFSGPIYRFKKYFSEVVTGRWDERCALRKGDDLWDVCDSINAAIGTLRERIRESHNILQETQKAFDELTYTVDENGKARIRALREKIDREDRVWKQRFPAPEPQTAGAGDTPAAAAPSTTSEVAPAAAPEAKIPVTQD